jgi:pilus assembly protein Flp/PilA
MTAPPTRSEDGASAVEYSLIVVAIAAVIVLVVFAVGRLTGATYSTTCTNLRAGDFDASLTCP